MVFSIIIPIYNTEKYLEKCLESIRKQKYKDFEVILIDDGSTDNSSKICDFYADLDNRFHVIHKNNEGQGVARNIALEKSKGDYIVFVDSDDFINFNLLRYLSHIIIQKNPEVIIYSVQFLSELKLKYCKTEATENIREEVLNNKEFWKKYLDNNSIIGGWVWNKCIKKELFTRYNLYFLNVRCREDAFLCTKLFQFVNRTVITNYIGYYQLVRHGSTEQSLFARDFLLSIKTEEMKVRFIRENIPDLYIPAYRNMVKVKISLLKMMVRDKREKLYNKEFIEIKNSLNEDLCIIKDDESCAKLVKIIIQLTKRPYIWKYIWRYRGIKEKIIKYKRYLYAKYI